MRIIIRNWAKYNPRKDLKQMNWFRVQNTIAHDRNLYGLVPEQKWAWIVLLSICAIENSGEIDIEPGFLAHEAGITEKAAIATIQHLRAKSIIRTDSERVRTDNSMSHDGKRPNVTNVTERYVSPTGDMSPIDGPIDDDPDLGPSQNRKFPGPNELAAIWNEHTNGSLPKVEKLRATSKRYRMAQARLREKPDLPYWTDVAKRISSSPFCQGNNDRGWRANFEFFVRPETHVKATEGVYGGESQERDTRFDNLDECANDTR